MDAIKKAWKFKKVLKSTDIDEVKNAVNVVVSIHEQHEKEIKSKCEANDFKDVEGVDFNIWAYTQLNRIEDIYNDLKSRYHELHFEKYQFNAY